MSDEIILKKEDLAVLNEQFSGLGQKIRAGEYVIEARQEGERKYEETHTTISKYFDATKLFVTIKPSEANVSSTIKSMSFEFDHFYSGKCGSWSSSETGSVTDSFRIETVSGKTYVYEPKSRDINSYDVGTKLLSDVRRLGLEKIQADASAAREEAWKRSQAAKEQARENRTAGLKSDLKF